MDANIAELEQTLLSMTIKDFKPYNLSGRVLIAKILRIHDGDTMTIGWKENDQFVKTNIRLIGIDTPELKSKNKKEALLCRLGRNWLSSTYLNKLATIRCKEMDKYGRLLADVFDYPKAECCINKDLITNRFARIYGGDLHKNEWTDAELDAGIAIAERLNVKDV